MYFYSVSWSLNAAQAKNAWLIVHIVCIRRQCVVFGWLPVFLQYIVINMFQLHFHNQAMYIALVNVQYDMMQYAII